MQMVFPCTLSYLSAVWDKTTYGFKQRMGDSCNKISEKYRRIAPMRCLQSVQVSDAVRHFLF